MTTMIPQTIPFDAPESEKRIFNLLRDDPSAADWRIIWSHRPRQFDLESGRRREIDFLIIIPNRGILCLEVKGGQFDLRNGQWHPLGNANAIEPPDRQSEQAMFALRHELQQQFPHDSGIQSTPIDFAVAFTDWAWPYNLRPPTPLIYDKNVIDIPGQLTNRISEAARRLQNPVGRGRRSRRPNDATTRTLLDYLAPNFRLTAGPQLDIINQQLIRLTQEQYIVLDLFAENPRCLIKGAAGTGKTMLSLEYARRAAQSGARVALLCFNLLLGNFLKEQTRNYPQISAGGFWPDIIRPLILQSPNREQFLQDETNAANENELYSNVYPHHAHLSLTGSTPKFDVLVVDEAPDLCLSPYLDLMNLLLAGGLSNGRWAMFGDFSHQAIFPGSQSGSETALSPYNPARVTLRVNCRNALPIARDTARIADSDLPETRQIQGPRPQYLYWQEPAQLPNLLDDEVHRLLSQNVRLEEIVVLSERRLEDSGLDPARAYGGHPLVTYHRGQRTESDDGTPRLKFCPIPAFKGMESEVVILLLDRLDPTDNPPPRINPAANPPPRPAPADNPPPSPAPANPNANNAARPFDPQNARAYAYIGMSRARAALTVLAPAALRPQLESRLAD